MAELPPDSVTSTGVLGPAMQMSLYMLVILGVILLALWALKRFGPKIGLRGPSKAHNLRFEGQITLGPKKSVMLVQFLNKLLVLGVTEQSINLLTEVDLPDEGQAEFANVLDKASNSDPGHDPDPSGPEPGRPGHA